MDIKGLGDKVANVVGEAVENAEHAGSAVSQSVEEKGGRGVGAIKDSLEQANSSTVSKDYEKSRQRAGLSAYPSIITPHSEALELQKEANASDSKKAETLAQYAYESIRQFARRLFG